MTYIKVIAGLLGIFLSLNAALIVIIDEESPLGSFYSDLWKRMNPNPAGQWVRDGAYDPFSDNYEFVVYYEDSVTSVISDYAKISAEVDGAYTANERSDPNSHLAKGVVVFAWNLEHAQHLSSQVTSAVGPVELTENVPTPLGSASILRFSRINDFCEKFRTFEPAQLCN